MWRALGVVLLLAGCAQLETQAPRDQVFELSGRLAARQGEEAFTGNVSWRHAGSVDELLVTSPLGQGVARIVRKEDAVVLTTAEPREYRAPDVELLTEQALGFRLPLKGLADWVLGRPAAGSEAEQHAATIEGGGGQAGSGCPNVGVRHWGLSSDVEGLVVRWSS